MKLVLAMGAVALLSACQMASPPPRTAEPPRAQPPSVQPPSSPRDNQPRTSPPSSPRTALPPRASPPSARPPSPPSMVADACGANRLQHLVGGPLPQPFPAPGPVRVFATGEPVTMDHNPQRLNVEVERGNRRRIVAITCG